MTAAPTPLPWAHKAHDEDLADMLEEWAIRLRGTPFRDGAVDIAYINGIEAAAERIRTGKVPDGL